MHSAREGRSFSAKKGTAPSLTFTAITLVPRVAAQVPLEGFRPTQWWSIRAQLRLTACQARTLTLIVKWKPVGL